jgi:predicted DNA-binding protein
LVAAVALPQAWWEAGEAILERVEEIEDPFLPELSLERIRSAECLGSA